MSLLDKVKKVASDAAEAAKKGTEKAKDKVEHLQLKKKLDGHAEQLGYLIYRERRQSTPAGPEADSLMDEMADLERQIAELDQEESEESGEDGATPSTPSA